MLIKLKNSFHFFRQYEHEIAFYVSNARLSPTDNVKKSTFAILKKMSLRKLNFHKNVILEGLHEKSLYCIYRNKVIDILITLLYKLLFDFKFKLFKHD